MGIDTDSLDISILKSLKPLRTLKQELLFKFNGWTVVSLLVGLFIFFPIGEILLSINSQSSNWSHLKETVLLTYFLNSFILVFGTAFISLIFGVSSAWLISNYQFKYGKILEWALVLPLAIPTYIAAYAYFDILEMFNPLLVWVRNSINIEAMQLLNDSLVYFVTILVMSSVLYPYIYLLARSAFLKQGKQLRDAAKTLGYNEKSVFWKIALPMARPAIIAGVSLVVMETLNDYGAVKHFGIPTFTSGIFRTWLGMGDLVGALQLSAVLIFFIFLLLALEKQARSRSKYHDSLHSKPTSKKIILNKNKSTAAIACCLTPLILGFVIPLFRLMSWAWISRDKASALVSIEMISNSLGLSIISSISIVLIALLLVFTSRYFNSYVINFQTVWLLLAIPYLEQ